MQCPSTAQAPVLHFYGLGSLLPNLGSAGAVQVLSAISDPVQLQLQERQDIEVGCVLSETLPPQAHKGSSRS